ncbi:MAG: dTDP-glucose 4,6-dehydratase [Bacillota bacterium]
MTVYLVTGGAGFIGSNFIQYLFHHKKNSKVINVDKLTYAGNLANLKTVEGNEGYTFIQEDICNGKLMMEIFKTYRPDIVINFAAESHVDRSIDDSHLFVETNVLGTHNLLQAALRYPVKKYIQISTDEVYGSLEDDGYFSEQSNLSPNNPYAASKAAGDMLVYSFYKTYGLPVNITRSTNNYGSNQHGEKLIPLIISRCLKGQRFPLYGDGRNVRDWIHVKDHCRAIDLVANRGVDGEIYNIGANQERDNIQVAKQIIDFLKELIEDESKKIKITEELIQFVEDRKGHDRRYAVDARKLKSRLGWSPTYTFEEGLKETIRWYLDHGNHVIEK